MKLTSTLNLLLFIGLWCCSNATLFAQMTMNNGDCNIAIDIPDNNCIEIDIVVSDAPGNQLGQNVFLEEVRLIINHQWRNDLQVMLVSPSGNTTVKLINERGGSGDNYGKPNGNDCSNPTILTQSACRADSIKNLTSSSETFGIFTPEESLNNFHLPSPFDPNGTWTLKICDDKNGDIGALAYAELVFVPPGCIAPTNLEAFNISATSIDLAWDNNGLCNGNNVIVEYGPAGFTPGNGTISGSSTSQVVVLPCFEEFDLTELNQLTTYDIYVRQTCGTYTYSYNSCKVRVQTECILPPITLLENFDNQASCNADGTCLDCPTISGVWRNAISDDVDWIVHNGGTVTSSTGPTGDVDGNGQYIYLESSGSCKPNKEAILSSDCIEIDASVGICHLSFYYHMYGINTNSLTLEMTTDGTNWQPLWSESGDQGNRWYQNYVNLSVYDGLIAQFRFRAISAAVNFRGDIGLDRIAFYGSQTKASAIFYADLDGDGFGGATDSIAVCFAEAPANYVLNNTDCDDTNAAINPDATEVPCNGLDENCSGSADDIAIFNPTFSVSPICNGEQANITATPSNNGQIYWFDTAMGNNPIDSGITYSTPILSDTTTYYFQESKDFSGQPCNSTIVPVEVIVTPKPAITNASGNQNICQNTSFDLRTLIIQDNNNATDTIFYYANDSYTAASRIMNPIISINSDTLFYIQARSNSGCTDEISISFTKQITPTAIINAPDTLNVCFQSDPQLITATEGGTGTGPFDYNWSTGSQRTEAVLFSRSKGFSQTISVTITSEGNGCAATDQIVVNTLPSISSVQVIDIQEPGFCQEDGAIIVEPLDGQAPYNYAWSGAGSGTANNLSTTNYTIPNLEMGAYNITVTDNFGCKKTLPQQFVNGPDLGIDNITDVSCFGQSNGAIEISVGGLVNPTFEWSDGITVISTNQNLAGLSGGIYSVTVDADNVAPCPIDSIVVIEPTLLELISKNVVSPSCAGLLNGSIELAITGGTPTANGYDFDWSNDIPNTSNPKNLAPNVYSVTITDALGCSTTDLSALQGVEVLDATLSATNPKCFGQDDGEISALVTGGTTPYSYQWDDDLNQTTSIAYGLVANLYNLKITDANGCEEIVEELLTNPPALMAAIDNITSPLCNEVSDGIINLNITGGTGNTTYLWNTMATTANLTEVSAGNYSVTVSDENNCSASIDSISVVVPELMDITFPNIQDPLCIGVDNGAIGIRIVGGVSPYGFDWNNGSTNANINDLSIGDYLVTVTDANGCIATSDTVNLQANQVVSIEEYLVIDSVQCTGLDNAVVFYRVASAASGASSFSFQWQDSTLITNNSDGFWVSSDYTRLSAGNYGLKIEDNLGCHLETSFVLKEPAPLKIDTILIEAPSCFGGNDGNAIAAVQGGTTPYIYSWTLPNSRIFRTINNVLPDIDGGNYQLEIIDANNCVSEAYTFEVPTSSAINIEVNRIKHVSCSTPENGIIDIAPTGGRGSFSFEWNNGLLTEDLSDLDVGIYTITLTDAAECSVSKSFEIKLEEDSLQIELIALENPTCNNATDGAIAIEVKGGFGAYEYFWSNGLQIVGGDTIRLENLSAGNYNVSVIDENEEFLCVGFMRDLTLIPAGSISVDLDDFENELNCFGDANGAFYITPNGGNAPYEYLWSNGDTNQDQENLPAGNYTLTITDALNCNWLSGELFPEILEPANPLAIANQFVTDALCIGDANGRIDLSFGGGSIPYRFNWNNGATTASIQNLLPGNYSLTATDENNCTLQFDTTIATKTADLEVNLSKADLTCFGNHAGSIQANVNCGMPPYQFIWNTGDTTQNLNNLAQGAYRLTITDAAGETREMLEVLRSPPLLKVDSIAIDIIGCVGMIDLQVSGGVSNSYNYTWRDESETIISTRRDATNLAAGNYRVTIQDANNCTIELNDLRIDNETIIDSVWTSSTFNKQSNRGTLQVDSIRGGTAPYSYLWFNEADEIIGTNAAVQGVLIGNYYVIASDQNNCEIRRNQIIDRTDALIDLEVVNNFNLYPNPTNAFAFLDIQFAKRVRVKMVLMNSIGVPLFQTEEEETTSIHQKIDLSNYPSGLFYLKLMVDDYPAFGEKIFHIKN